ncbi:MAG: proline--tRNA ligase [Gammaproteobacteria bacterium GWF2_41_13]|nr:MAG: proline--tRNA ligase [Gammaproteobacteria bacterium GWF2_41_13]
MKTNHFLLSTVKEVPADAELISHQLMIRAGMIRKLAAGIYTWLPLGLRVLKKVEKVVREEMDRIGAQEILMPSIQPAELWHESGRWAQYGAELLRIMDRHHHEFCYGPTHEEVVTDLARRELRSYKQLPLILYQIQTKFRDEIRPRFGVMRAREFLMKDAYSFHEDEASLKETYDIMYETYARIFRRLGLNCRAVLADSGTIGGKITHEFHGLAESGESLLAYSDVSDYAANVETAEAVMPSIVRQPAAKKMELVHTGTAHTIEEVCNLLKIDPKQTVKTLIVKGREQPFVALVLRGDHQLNEIKVAQLDAVASPLVFASEADVLKTVGCPVGSIGPIDLNMPVIIDRSASVLSDFVCGANQTDHHYRDVNWERDVVLGTVIDIRNVEEGDPSPDGKGRIRFARGIEVGQVFQLGTRYSTTMNATVLNEKGEASTLMMGCYGIGVSRTVAAVIEQSHDDKGIVWPDAMAPFHIAIIPLIKDIQDETSQKIQAMAEKLYEQLMQAGYEVLLDDRAERPGVKFADMDLIGIPHRLVLSPRLGLEQVEYKSRKSAGVMMVNIDQVIPFLQEKTG